MNFSPMNNHFESALSFVLTGLWRATWQASALAIVVLVVQKILGARLGGRGRFALWAIVVVRLLLPVLPESRFSVFNLAPARTSVAKTVADPVVAPAEPDQIPVIVIGAQRTAKPQAAKEEVVADPVAPAPGIRWRAWVFAAWIAGVIVLGLRVAQVCWELSRTIRRLSVIADDRLLNVARSCAALLRLKRLPTLLAGENVSTPAVVGLFRPKLLLPSHVLATCDDREIRLIILHELAHLKRHDIAGNWLIALASIVHWFNPIVWLLSARMRADRELACDELVLSASSGEAQAYGRTLLKLIEILSPKVRSLAVSPRELAIVGILESTTPMQRRVRMIAQFDPKQSRRWIWTFVVLGLLACVALTDAVRGDGKPAPVGANPTSPATQPASTIFSSAINSETGGKSVDTAAFEIRAYDINNLIVGANLDRNNEISAVENALTKLVDPHSWTDAQMQEVNGKLIIQQTPANHDKIAELLKLLSSEQPAQPPSPGAGGSLAVMGPGQPPVQPPVVRTVVSDDQIEAANSAALASLHKKIPEVKFDNVPFCDVIDFFRDTTGANISVNWQALEQQGVDKNAPITTRVKDVSFDTVLNSTLRQLGAEQAVVVIDQGVITITSGWDLPSYMLTKTYDVKDLVSEQAEPNAMQSLVTVVQTVATSPAGMNVQSYGNKLIVTAVPNAHEQVEKLLADLRSPTTKPVSK